MHGVACSCASLIHLRRPNAPAVIRRVDSASFLRRMEETFSTEWTYNTGQGRLAWRAEGGKEREQKDRRILNERAAKIFFANRALDIGDGVDAFAGAGYGCSWSDYINAAGRRRFARLQRRV